MMRLLSSTRTVKLFQDRVRACSNTTTLALPSISTKYYNTSKSDEASGRQSHYSYDHPSTKNLQSIPSTSFHANRSINQIGSPRYLLLQTRQMSTNTLPPSILAKYSTEIYRLRHLRNVGIFAHVDAGKTTVTERMLALAGIVPLAGSVDSGNTVTDYLPAERERGITIQSAAISFEWKWHNSDASLLGEEGKSEEDEQVTIQLIDTPGHVDFSVEVNRSVAVLDGAVLVVDAVAGVQAQTETVWRAMTRPSMKNHDKGLDHDKENCSGKRWSSDDTHGHEPLPCIAFVNKMDKEGCNFGYALNTLKKKLPGANPVAMQVPLFAVGNTVISDTLAGNIVAVPASDLDMRTVTNGKFVGLIDLVEMRAIVWPEVGSGGVADVEECVPAVYNLFDVDSKAIDPDSQVTIVALAARQNLVASLADVDEGMEEIFLMEKDPSNYELRSALRRATLDRKILPVMTGAALRGKGVEPLLDAMADLLPSPLNRKPPALLDQGDASVSLKSRGRGAKKDVKILKDDCDGESQGLIKFGHPLHPSLLALAFKVVHMKNRGGSGDGRVVFARVYSGKLSSRDTVKVITPANNGENPEKPRTERVGGMLELAGGKFDNLKDAVCYSGDVCALIGLKSVSTGDTILLASNEGKGKKKKKSQKDSEFEISSGNECLAGVGAPKPVLTVRVEAENAEQESKLLEALNLLVAEDPSLQVEETGSATLLSGLGELHIEVVVDRLKREHGLAVWIGKPSVAYRETVQRVIETPGLMDYDRTIGSTRMQAMIHLRLEPYDNPKGHTSGDCIILCDPVVTLGSKVREFLGFDNETDESELAQRCNIANALISGCKGALKRGPMGSFEIANVKCHVEEIDAEGGIASLKALPGAIRAASSTILTSVLNSNKAYCSVLEPTMSVEISASSEMVGTVLSDLTTRRGTVDEVIMGDDDTSHTKALIRGQVPLAEILGYANNLRSITGGEGTFSAEYKGHSACDLG